MNRCKDKLEALAIKVMNQWPGSPPETPPVKVRVKEAWDDNLLHGETSLHYEGRAVDVATSDRDRSKLGTLARLAVEAGFDWVEYESHGHIHCSVQSDSSAAIKNGGCFNGESTVRLSDGKTRTMAEIQVGDHVMSMRSDGVIEYSEIIAFMDRDDNGYGLFYTLHTETGESITLTAKHLVYIVNQNMSLTIDRMDAVFAESVEEGQFLLIGERDSIRLSQVTAVTVETRRGIYAPLTKHGTIVVDDIVASCYAFIDNIVIAHAAFAPMRAYHDISQFLPSYTWSVDNNDTSVATPTGMHWYANVLYTVGRTLFSKDTLYVH
ncbi:SHH-like protein [Mya arenaria]|uniref:SHH-like protein n=1 Tax=Mya arenaria TaxID=6604 RepID=A0ABY7E743_MYAAR|nr:SHH-like protein [Mya arenaria]